MSAVQALSFLGCFYGAQELGIMYFGMHIFTLKTVLFLKSLSVTRASVTLYCRKVSEQFYLSPPPPYRHVEGLSTARRLAVFPSDNSTSRTLRSSPPVALFSRCPLPLASSSIPIAISLKSTSSGTPSGFVNTTNDVRVIPDRFTT